MENETPALTKSRSSGYWLRSIVQLILLILVIFFGYRYVNEQWSRLSEQVVQANWRYLVAAQLGIILGFWLLPLGSWFMLRAIGHPRGWVLVWRMFLVSNIAKYLPGSIWALPGRAFLYQRSGIPAGESIFAVFWEVMMTIAGAVLLAACGTRLAMTFLSPILALLILASALLGSLIVYLLLASSKVRQKFFALPFDWPRAINHLKSEAQTWPTTRQTNSVLASYGLCWLVIGISFSLIARSTINSLSIWNHLELVGLYTGSWVFGFLVVIAPGGIGVREASLIAGLALFAVEPIPGFIAIVARVMWTVAEITTLAVILVFSLVWKTNSVIGERERSGIKHKAR